MIGVAISCYVGILCVGAISAIFSFLADVREFKQIKEKIVIQDSKQPDIQEESEVKKDV